jgi:hypothetical protein
VTKEYELEIIIMDMFKIQPIFSTTYYNVQQRGKNMVKRSTMWVSIYVEYTYSNVVKRSKTEKNSCAGRVLSKSFERGDSGTTMLNTDRSVANA